MNQGHGRASTCSDECASEKKRKAFRVGLCLDHEAQVKFKVACDEWWCDEAPNPCPLCHHAIDARFLTGVVRQVHPMAGAVLELVFQCPRNACLQGFIGYYDGAYDRNLLRPDSHECELGNLLGLGHRLPRFQP